MRYTTVIEKFGLRKAVKTRQWHELETEEAVRYADLHATLEDSSTESRYSTWLDNGTPERVPGANPALGCRHREVLLHHDYRVADYVELHAA